MASSLQSTMPIAREALYSAFSLSSRTFFINPIRKFTIPTTVLSHSTSKCLQLSRNYSESESLAAISAPKQCQPIRSPELVALEYSDLNLPHNSSEVRIKKNPKISH